MRSAHVIAALLVFLNIAGTAHVVRAQGTKAASRRAENAVLVRVDGQPITQADLDRMFKSRLVEPALQPKVRGEFLDQLIDSQLMLRFLKAQKIAVSESELDGQVEKIKALLPESAAGQLNLQEHGYTEKILREELALPLMWRNYVLQTVSDAEVQKYFEQHRAELDGTEIRASQIFAKVADLKDPQQVAQAKAKLEKIRKEVAGGLDFAQAAEKYSQAPSGKKGGDVGWLVLGGGKMPRACTQAAIALEPGEMTEPIVSPFGVHLLQVTDRRPGQHSLEDVRAQVMQGISSELQRKKVQELRAKAKIERLAE